MGLLPDEVGDAGPNVGADDDGNGGGDVQAAAGHERNRHRRRRRRTLHDAGSENTDEQTDERICGGFQQLLGEVLTEELERRPHQRNADKEYIQ